MSQGLLCTFIASKNVYLLMWKIGKHREQLVKIISEAVFLFLRTRKYGRLCYPIFSAFGFDEKLSR